MNLMPNAAHTLAVSLSPDEAICYLGRVYSTLVVFDAPDLPPELIAPYQGRILIHTLGFPDEPPIKHLCQEILAEFGFDVDTFPALSIQGLATVIDVVKYDPESFASDREAHGCGESLSAYQADSEKFGCDAWGIRLSDTFILDRPVCDVIPSANVGNGTFWLPQSEAHLDDFRAALQRDQQSLSHQNY